MATQIKCAFPECSYIAAHDSEQIAVLQFQSHLASHTQSTAVKSSKQKLPPNREAKIEARYHRGGMGDFYARMEAI